MALKDQALTVCYQAWNTSANQGQPGDAGNHTLKLVQDGTEGSPTNSPTEVDSTGAPGLYKLALTAGDMNFNCVALCGKSSTSNVVIIPLVIVTERGVLPTAAAGAANGFFINGANTGPSSISGGLTVNLTGNLSGAVGSVTGTVSANTTQFGGENVQLDANNLPKVDVADWGGATAGTIPATDSSGRVTLAPAGLNAITAETGINLLQLFQVIAAILGGEVVVSNGGLTATFYALGDAAQANPRAVIVTDSSNDRTSVTLTP